MPALQGGVVKLVIIAGQHHLALQRDQDVEQAPVIVLRVLMAVSPRPGARGWHVRRVNVCLLYTSPGVQKGRRVVDQLHDGAAGNDGVPVKVREFAEDGRAVDVYKRQR